jgi:hypothetical protein
METLINNPDHLVFSSAGAHETGFLAGMPEINDDNYYDDRKYITNSMLSMLNESPAKLKAYLDSEKQKEVNAFVVGDAVHKGILEPEKFNKIMIWRTEDMPQPDKTLRTKENAVWLARLKANHEGEIILAEKDYALVKGMVNSIKSKPRCEELLSDAHYELIALRTVRGINMKSKGDIVRNDKTLIDIKTTKSIDINSFRESCDNYGYWRQAALYAHMFDCDKFSFICVEKTAPYPVAVYHVPHEKLQKGWEDVTRLIGLYKQYFIEQSLTISEHVVEETL